MLRLSIEILLCTVHRVLLSIKLFFLRQADRGFARSRLCTDEDGTTNNLVLYMVRNDTSKKGGDAPRATD